MIYGVGIDIVDVSRVAHIYQRFEWRFLKKIFNANEFHQFSDSNKRSNKVVRMTFLAGRFAAKEAIAKALGTGIGQIGWQEIEIIHAENGQPGVVLHGRAHQLSRKKGIARVHLSISHEHHSACAFAVAEQLLLDEAFTASLQQ